MSGYLARNPLMTDDPQFGPPPVVAGRPVLPNALAMPAGDWRDVVAPQPTQAEAADATAKAYTEWLARDRAEQIRLGYVDPATGQLTPEGWRQQAQVIGGGFGPADIGALGIGAIKAYHGSPHAFERFDMSKIGTGEGAQAYGHGLYFAEREGIAQGYRDKLSAFDLKYGSDPVATSAHDTGPPGAADAAMDLRDRVRAGDDPAVALQNLIAENRQKAAAWEKKRPAFAGTSADASDVYARLSGRHTTAADWLETLDPAKLQAGTGHMYEVNLNVEPDQMLHWDKPLSEQSPHVQEALQNAGYDLSHNPRTAAYGRERTGGELLKASGDQAKVAQELQAAGIPGISYLDAGSRGVPSGLHFQGRPIEGNPQLYSQPDATQRALTSISGYSSIDELNKELATKGHMLQPATLAEIQRLVSEGHITNPPAQTLNHVIFDDATIDVLRKYGIAGLIGGGAAATAAGGNQGQSQ